MIKKTYAQSAGFEPARAEPNGFLVHRLNHSATTASLKEGCKNPTVLCPVWKVEGSNPPLIRKIKFFPFELSSVRDARYELFYFTLHRPGRLAQLVRASC